MCGSGIWRWLRPSQDRPSCSRETSTREWSQGQGCRAQATGLSPVPSSCASPLTHVAWALPAWLACGSEEGAGTEFLDRTWPLAASCPWWATQRFSVSPRSQQGCPGTRWLLRQLCRALKDSRSQQGATRVSPRIPTHTVCFTMSEWILATPLTACEPITQRWAMLMRLQSPSSITDILRKRSTSPGNRAATCWGQNTAPWAPRGPAVPRGQDTAHHTPSKEVQGLWRPYLLPAPQTSTRGRNLSLEPSPPSTCFSLATGPTGLLQERWECQQPRGCCSSRKELGPTLVTLAALNHTSPPQDESNCSRLQDPAPTTLRGIQCLT